MAGQMFLCEECNKMASEWAYDPWGGRYFCYSCGSISTPRNPKLVP